MAKKKTEEPAPVIHDGLVCPKCGSHLISVEGDKCRCRDCGKKF